MPVRERLRTTCLFITSIDNYIAIAPALERKVIYALHGVDITQGGLDTSGRVFAHFELLPRTRMLNHHGRGPSSELSFERTPVTWARHECETMCDRDFNRRELGISCLKTQLSCRTPAFVWRKNMEILLKRIACLPNPSSFMEESMEVLLKRTAYLPNTSSFIQE